MKRYLAVFACFSLLLCACGAAQPEFRVQNLQHRYTETERMTANVAVSVVCADETASYRLHLEHGADETKITLLEPEEIAGIGAVVSSGELSIVYDGMVLSAGSLMPGLSAVNAADVVLRAAADGYVTEQSYERYEDTEALRLCLETELDGETLHTIVFFDAEDAPLYAEIESQGEILAYLEFTDFAFGDILPTA